MKCDKCHHESDHESDHEIATYEIKYGPCWAPDLTIITVTLTLSPEEVQDLSARQKKDGVAGDLARYVQHILTDRLYGIWD